MEARFELVAVAFLRGAGGRVRVLLAIDRDGTPLFGGDPALLVEHRPGAASAQVVVEGAEHIAPETLEQVHAHAHEQLAALIEAAFDETGKFDGERLLGRAIALDAAHDCFDAM